MKMLIYKILQRTTTKLLLWMEEKPCQTMTLQDEPMKIQQQQLPNKQRSLFVWFAMALKSLRLSQLYQVRSQLIVGIHQAKALWKILCLIYLYVTYYMPFCESRFYYYPMTIEPLKCIFICNWWYHSTKHKFFLCPQKRSLSNWNLAIFYRRWACNNIFLGRN